MSKFIKRTIYITEHTRLTSKDISQKQLQIQTVSSQRDNTRRQTHRHSGC